MQDQYNMRKLMMKNLWVNFGKQIVLSQTPLIEPLLCPAHLDHFLQLVKQKPHIRRLTFQNQERENIGQKERRTIK